MLCDMFLSMQSKQEGVDWTILITSVSFDTLVELASMNQFLNDFILPEL